VRHSQTWAGGSQDSGRRPSLRSSRRWRASARSVLARRLLPRRALVSAGSARCGITPAALSSSQTNSQPVQASSATSIRRPGKRSTQAETAARLESIRPRLSSPVSVSRASKVIWARCTSNPATIAIRASFDLRFDLSREASRAEQREALLHAIFTQITLTDRLARLRGAVRNQSNELDADLYLRIADELYLKQLIVGGLERVYELEGLPHRAHLVHALARVHAGRVVRALRRLPRHDGTHRGARPRCRRGGWTDARHVPCPTRSTWRRRGSASGLSRRSKTRASGRATKKRCGRSSRTRLR
jgi:hypothetical protein